MPQLRPDGTRVMCADSSTSAPFPVGMHMTGPVSYTHLTLPTKRIV